MNLSIHALGANFKDLKNTSGTEVIRLGPTYYEGLDQVRYEKAVTVYLHRKIKEPKTGTKEYILVAVQSFRGNQLLIPIFAWFTNSDPVP